MRLLNPKFRKAALISIALQAPIMLFGMVLLDGGVILRIACDAAIAFWAGALLIAARRPAELKRSDIAYLKWGYLPLLLVTACFLSLASTLVNMRSR